MSDEERRGEDPRQPGRFEALVGHGRRARRRLAAHAVTDAAYRSLIGVVGSLVVLVGAILIPFPFPVSGWFIVVLGLVILSTEFAWAERVLRMVRTTLHTWTTWLTRQSLMVRASVTVATALFVAGVLYVATLLFGVPSWLPSWLVPPLPGLDS